MIKSLEVNVLSELWGISAYYNPVKYQSKRKNFLTFRGASKKQGLKLIVVEMVLEGNEPELERSDAEIHVVVNGCKENMLWQKEALLNIGLKYLPAECKYIAWLDSDVIFINKNWIKQTTELLQTYSVLQPFSHFVQLPPCSDENQCLSQKSYNSIEKRLKSFAYGLSLLGISSNKPFGRTGNAWAARRDFLDKHNFYDSLILGDGDSFMAYAFTGCNIHLKRVKEDFPLALLQHYEKWANRVFSDVEGRVGCVEGLLLHLWHGTPENRRYKDRRGIIKRHHYDPDQHIKKNKDGILCWNTSNDSFLNDVKDYFFQRDEDDFISSKLKKNILITGMTGVVGGIIGRALEQKYPLSTLSRKFVDGVKTTIADIRDVEAMGTAFDGIDTVIHVAADCADDGIRQIDVNIRGSYNLYETAVQAGVRRVVYISSGAVQEAYEKEEPFLSMVENRLEDIPDPTQLLSHVDPVRPYKMYGVAKACIETMGRMYSETKGLSVLCLRLGRVRPQDRPYNSREAAVYLSHRDLIQLVEKSIEAPESLKYGIYYGVSDNKMRFFDLVPAFDDLGYKPEDGVQVWPETSQ